MPRVAGLEDSCAYAPGQIPGEAARQACARRTGVRARDRAGGTRPGGGSWAGRKGVKKGQGAGRLMSGGVRRRRRLWGDLVARGQGPLARDVKAGGGGESVPGHGRAPSPNRPTHVRRPSSHHLPAQTPHHLPHLRLAPISTPRPSAETRSAGPIDYSSPAAVHTTLIHSVHPLIYTARRRSTRPLATSFEPHRSPFSSSRSAF